MKSLLLTLPIVALFALSGCGTPGPIYQSNLDRANQYLSNGNASAAEAELLGIQSSFELEDGSPLEQLGFHKAYADTSLQLGFLAEPVFLSRDALDPTTIAARTQAIEAARKQYREARKLVIATILATDMTCHFGLTDELKAFVKDRLAPYKYPRYIEFVDELPKTATGKIQRFRLRASEEGA